MSISFAWDYYITEQWKQDILYGKYPTTYNGCGWIATYNYIRTLSNICIPEVCEFHAKNVKNYLEKTLHFGGALGTSPFAVRRFLEFETEYKFDIKLKFPFQNYKPKKHGIVYYFDGRGIHFAHYNVKESNDGRRIWFYNVNERWSTETFEEFYGQFIYAPIYLIIEPHGDAL